MSACLHQPGAIITNLSRTLPPEDFARWKPYLNDDLTPKAGIDVFKTIPEGAATTATAAFDPRWEKLNGAYLADSQIAKDFIPGETFTEGGMSRIKEHAKDKASARRLWDWTNKLLGTNF